MKKVLIFALVVFLILATEGAITEERVVNEEPPRRAEWKMTE